MNCPNCGTNDVLKQGTGFKIFLGIALIGLAFFMLLIPFLGIFMAIGSVLLGLLLIVSAPFTEDNYKCNNCGNTWKEEKQKDVEEIQTP